jgi:hypothetical protein
MNKLFLTLLLFLQIYLTKTNSNCNLCEYIVSEIDQTPYMNYETLMNICTKLPSDICLEIIQKFPSIQSYIFANTPTEHICLYLRYC